MNRNEKQLESFIAYCKANPHLRFWQALLSWVKQGRPDVGFILFSNFAPHDFGKENGWLKDTFNLEDK